MKIRISIIIGLLIALTLVNRLALGGGQRVAQLGGVPWHGWAATAALLVVAGLLFARLADMRARRLLMHPASKELQAFDSKLELARQRREQHGLTAGPDYPYPYIIESLCIACNRCVEACPHDVLTMTKSRDGKGFVASVANRDLCMEDTACESACPTNACIVINTTKDIPRLPAPERNECLMTNVPGCYVIGDVSGVPLIRSAVKEGVDVIEHIAKNLAAAPPEPKAEVDVVIVGIGPAGLSAALSAKQHNLRFLGLEQARVLSTIEAYPKRKRVEFKPAHIQTRSILKIKDDGDLRENILESWPLALAEHEIGVNKNNDPQPADAPKAINVINENEKCAEFKAAEDGDYFIVKTSRGPERQEQTYLARRVVLSIGHKGAAVPLQKSVAGLSATRPGESVVKVLDKLSEPDKFRGLHIVIVGGGNSAVEAALDLISSRDEDRLELLPAEVKNCVTLLVRSNLTNDVSFRNKRHLFHCKDEGQIDIRFNTELKEIRPTEVVILNTRTQQEETIRNDYVFALIGSQPPHRFLEQHKIKIIGPADAKAAAAKSKTQARAVSK
jgi:thioredoxin reductase (NADPH)